MPDRSGQQAGWFVFLASPVVPNSLTTMPGPESV